MEEPLTALKQSPSQSPSKQEFFESGITEFHHFDDGSVHVFSVWELCARPSMKLLKGTTDFDQNKQSRQIVHNPVLFPERSLLTSPI
jgi:hypothetical protein